MYKKLFIGFLIMIVAGIFTFCGDEPATTTAAPQYPPEIEVVYPKDFVQIPTNVIFVIRVSDDDGVRSASIQFDEDTPVEMEILSNTGFLLRTNFEPVSALRVVISASDSNNQVSTLTNTYEVVVPDVSDWTVNIAFHNTGWDQSASAPLAVMIAPRTNNEISTSAESWDWSARQISTTETETLSVTFTNIPQNVNPVTEGQYTLVVFQDSDNDRDFSLIDEFPFYFEEHIIDGVNSYSSDIDLYLLSGRITNSDPAPGSNYFILLTPSMEDNFEVVGIGGGHIPETNTSIAYMDYRAACTRTGTFYIMGMIMGEISEDLSFTNGIYMGFYGALLTPHLYPRNPNAVIRSTGANDGFSFRLAELPDEWDF